MSFRAAVEARDVDALEASLAPDVRFQSPAVYRAYEGRETTMVVLRAVLSVFQDFRYVDALRDGDRELLRFAARVGDREVDGIDLIRRAPDGRVAELTVMVRPLSGLVAVRDAIAAQLAQ
ncbi:MAG TPA: nuclear transport factor 2 family protein [Solirubrobacteraceae bacterium]|jgi:hypothetical protein|nr:nuclear transport factor 2 family protein [Solirubrobacteraceae bacterium]